MTYLTDVDGTLADCSHRLHFINGEKPDWRSFFAACSEDKPIFPVIRTIRALHSAGARIVIVSGRSDECWGETMEWLDKYLAIPYAGLFMRKAGDHRPDNIVKAELLDKILETIPQRDIVAVFDDRNSVVKMWREKGLTCYQAADGNF